MPVPKACQSLADQLEAARKELAHIQGLPGLHRGPGRPAPREARPGMLREAEQEEAVIRKLSGELDACLREHGICPTQLSTFAGRATLSSSKGSGHSHFSITLELDEPHHHAFLRPGLSGAEGRGGRSRAHDHADGRRERPHQVGRPRRPPDRPSRRRILAGRPHDAADHALDRAPARVAPRRARGRHARGYRHGPRRAEPGSRVRSRSASWPNGKISPPPCDQART